MSDDLMKQMVDRFLQWKLPEDFNPDAGISFKRYFNEHLTPPMRHEPAGTNLLNARQAEDMVRYITEAQTAEITRLREQLAEAQMKSLADLGQAQDAWEAQKDAERQRDAARTEALEEAAQHCDMEADNCDDAVKWGGSRRYISDCKAAAYAMRNRAAAIRALIKKDRA